MSVDWILHSPHAAAKETAGVFDDVLRKRGRIGPAVVATEVPYLAPGASAAEAVERVNALSAEAILVVGHQPQLTQLARKWLGRRLPADALPLAGSEVACIRLGKPPRLLWLLTEKPSDLKTDVREKIKSKLEVAKFFLGALVVNASVVLSSTVTPLWRSPLSPVLGGFLIAGSAALVLSLGLTVATSLAFDRLAMPSEFWSEPSNPRTISQLPPPPESSSWSVPRPPSEAVVVLFYEMTHVWKWLFEPALISGIVSIVCLFLAVIVSKNQTAAHNVLMLLSLLALLTVVLVLFYQANKPKLGFDD